MKDAVVPLMTRLPAELHTELKQLAQAEDRSLNWMIVALLREGLQARADRTQVDHQTRPA